MGLTQSQLAALCGMESSHVSHIELGDRNITLDTIGSLAEGLNVHVSDLFTFDMPDIGEQDKEFNIFLASIKRLPPDVKKRLAKINTDIVKLSKDI